MLLSPPKPIIDWALSLFSDLSLMRIEVFTSYTGLVYLLKIKAMVSAMNIVMANGMRDRQVILSEKLLSVIRKYRTEFTPKAFLFESSNGGKYSPRSVQSVFQHAVKTAGIKKHVSVHTLRHSFATHLLDIGTDILYIQELLGHKHLSTTQIYSQISPHSLNKVKSPFDSL